MRATLNANGDLLSPHFLLVQAFSRRPQQDSYIAAADIYISNGTG
jgi:hypothetical protein